MKKITVKASKKYDILISHGILEQTSAILSEIKKPCVAAVVCDDTVNKLYADTVCASLKQSGYRPIKYVFFHGEASKNAKTYVEILEFLAQNGVTRSDVILALGGGVCGDLAGFAAATYLRGTDYVQIPTTLLAAIDSSVGGKTGIDLGAGKNLAGAFWQPCAVICDLNTFDTLPPETFADGVAEAVKYGAIADRKLFETLQNGSIREKMRDIVFSCVSVKRDFVEKDEFDRHERKLLNFGHTFGHAVEKCSNYKISHGRAVAVGMVIAARISEKTGYAAEPCADALISALERYGLPTKSPYSAPELAHAALSDKKRGHDGILLVLIEKIGKCGLKEVPVCELEGLIELGL